VEFVSKECNMNGGLSQSGSVANVRPSAGNADGSWLYPHSSKEVLDVAGLNSITHNIYVRRQTVAPNFIVNRPI